MANSNNPKGSGNNKKSRKSVKLRSQSEPVEQCSWGEVDVGQLIATIQAVTLGGGGFMQTRSRDGGVIGVKIYHDDFDNGTIWFRPEEASAILYEIHEMFVQGGYSE